MHGNTYNNKLYNTKVHLKYFKLPYRLTAFYVFAA